MSAAWVVVARIPQIDGGVREVLVERCHGREVREVLRQDPARVERLWCPIQTRDDAGVYAQDDGGIGPGLCCP